MNRIRLALPLALAVLPGATPAAPMGDAHLEVLPLSAAEAARRDEALAASRAGTDSAFERSAGGAATVPRAPGEAALRAPSANMTADRRLDFELGKAIFDKLWVAAPASTKASDGLGPLYNSRACAACHIRDGRGRAPGEEDGGTGSLLFRLGSEGGPDPVYGMQLQDRAAPGQVAEGRVSLSYEPQLLTLADGTIVTLRAPRYALTDPGFGAFATGLGLSPRMAPPMTGLGLIEAIPSANILALADPDDSDRDGISGRARMVASAEYGGELLGRFGLKAGVATVREQVARAFSADMGLSTPLFPDPWGDCTGTETACRAGPHGQEPEVRDGLEVDGKSLDLVTFYARNLAPPARDRTGDPPVVIGKALFHDLGCAACHHPAFVTAKLTDRPEQSFQLIWPYSDFLLHDMGPELADTASETGAGAAEWRTPPLWSIGLAQSVDPAVGYLHDGRARNLLEAILWHGGEAGAARDRVIALSKPDRDALIAFLESL
ncbi:thiol oxidoreductase [Frigidibacter sp. RF13]|uniref:di-heme oxidoreductase family protein n=1 Tax=Frigidibacter sp. RF13 TaxID=2997340 RepID=UPI00226DF07E|nr:di-heme oxidoredictase family protein [Frigidibacter sp. RF13]MCY1126004.1 thiol oxidoreductase [Frigidibacter sp. RF13]